MQHAIILDTYTYRIRRLARTIEADTIWLELDRGWGDRSVKSVRLLGVSTPSSEQGDGVAAAMVRQAVTGWFDHYVGLGRAVCWSVALDPSGQSLARIYPDGKADNADSLNTYLLGTAMAQARAPGAEPPVWIASQLEAARLAAEREVVRWQNAITGTSKT